MALFFEKLWSVNLASFSCLRCQIVHFAFQHFRLTWDIAFLTLSSVGTRSLHHWQRNCGLGARQDSKTGGQLHRKPRLNSEIFFRFTPRSFCFKKRVEDSYFFTRAHSCSAFFGWITSSTAQGGGGSFKNRKPIGEVGCCESGMAERIHWWTERCLRSPLFLSLSLTIYLPIYLLCIYLSIDLSIYLSLSLSLSFI